MIERETLDLEIDAELLDHSAAWNDLWQRSDCAWPTMRAEPLAQWMETFSPRAEVQILAVEDSGALLAALPLVEDRWGPLRIGKLPGGDLCSVGDLLVDRDFQQPQASPLRMIVEGLAAPLADRAVRCDVSGDSAVESVLSAAENRGMRYLARYRGVTGMIEVRGTWDAYFAQRSRNHRRHMRVVHKRAEEEGKLELRLIATPPCDEIEPLLRRGFEVEDRGWKGKGGSSTLREPGAFPYFVEQARLLSASEHLLLAFLDLDDRTIAFEYGWLSKGVYHSLKVGFDEAFQQLSPGQLLRYLMMERLFRGGEVTVVDYLGPLSGATGKWTMRTYPVSRLILSNGILGRTLLKLYRGLKGSESAAPSADATVDPGKCELRETAQAAEE